MGETISFTAALKKGDQADYLVLKNGEQIKLPLALPYTNGEEVVVHIVSNRHPQAGPSLAKQIVQEILNGE